MDIARLEIKEALNALGSRPTGLSPEEARLRLLRDGPNSLQEVRGPSLVLRFLRQFTHFLALLLWIAAGLSFLAEFFQPGQGMATLGWAILAVILINACFSFIQEYKAERAVQALRRLLPAMAWVLRSGQPQEVPRRELVPGDLLLLEEGEQVPADARLIEAIGLRLDNSSLTGEAKPKRRTAEAVPETNPLDAANLVFAGTTILSGRGRAVVYATGVRTEFGKIAQMTTLIESGLSPLQREIVRVTHVVAILSSVMGLAFFIIGWFMGLGFWVSAVFGIGIIAANVPEGLLPAVTLALAMGSQRMAKRKALIKRLTSVETLGCTTVICTDKTGTLTMNRMEVERLYVNGGEVEAREGQLLLQGKACRVSEQESLRLLCLASALCNNARLVRRGEGPGSLTTVQGDPTEVALLTFAQRYGPADWNHHARMGELPFDADRKRMSTLHWMEGKLGAFVKGAPEVIIALCSRTYRDGVLVPFTQDMREAALAQSRAFAHQAYRVLAVATREIERGLARHLTPDTVEQDLIFLGLVAMMDPPHREVPEAVARCRKAGVRVVMITGDHPLTALAVARLIGLVPAESDAGQNRPTSVVEGAQVDAMSDDELKRRLVARDSDRTESVFARMAPRHKMRIVSLLKEMGEVVAVTGDGVNDAPALKKADIGIAMGIAGTDVAKETAAMILLDDNFATIVNAIEEGRAVYANIRKFVTYVLASNVPEVVPYLGYGLFQIPLALTIPQVLAVDLGTDMVPAVALGAESPHPGIMESRPRPRTERLLSVPVLLRVYAFLGLIEAGIAMAAFFWFLRMQGWTWGAPLAWTDPLSRQATTVTFAAIVVAQVANVFACRSERVSVFRLGFLTNPFLLWGVAAEVALLALIVYTPLGNRVLGTMPLPWWAWLPLIAGAIGLLAAEELRKLLVRRTVAGNR